MGNHDDRMAIRANGAGIPRELMDSFGEIIGAPEVGPSITALMI